MRLDVLPPRLRVAASTLSNLVWMFRNQPFRVFAELMRVHWRAWRKAETACARVNLLGEEGLRARKRSDRIFVFGSGYSLNEIPDAEWLRIAECDSLAFSGSFYLRKFPFTYCMLRGWNETVDGVLNWRKDVEEVLGIIDANPFLDDSLFFLQRGFTATFCNHILASGLWNGARPMRRYYTDKAARFPTPGRWEIAHRAGTLCSAVSLAVSLGYSEIVLAGVDLYDSRYFWLPPDKTLGWSESEQKLVASDTNSRGDAADHTHNTVHNGVIDIMGQWREHLSQNYGVRLSVYNPKSLMARSLPVFSWD